MFNVNSVTSITFIYCLTSSGKYFMHIQDVNKFNNIEAVYRNEGATGQSHSTATVKVWRAR